MLKTESQTQSIATRQPETDASIYEWVDWFWASFLPSWVEHARAPAGFGFYDVLDEHAQPIDPHRRTLLAQARLLFTFSHLALLSENPAYHAAARTAYHAVAKFRKPDGTYCRARSIQGGKTADPADELAYSYDQSFVILGLATWGRLHPEESVESELQSCWSALENQLTDHKTGLLLEHNGLTDPAAADAPYRAQNPHMHLYEAALQAFEMTGKPVWLARAKQMRAKGLEYFFDRGSGTMIEFLAPDLTVLTGRAGQRREIGHQCEWAWLLLREAELGRDQSVCAIAAQLLAFADQYGFATEGVMQGAAFDAVAADTSWHEARFLLWPQTEAIKTYAIRKDEADFAQKGRDLALLIFRRYFAGRAAFANQLDAQGQALWPDALSRLHYHLVLALTEGGRAGLWLFPVH